LREGLATKRAICNFVVRDWDELDEFASGQKGIDAGLHHEELFYERNGFKERLTGVEPCRVIDEIIA
jgi:hypothetical protein